MDQQSGRERILQVCRRLEEDVLGTRNPARERSHTSLSGCVPLGPHLPRVAPDWVPQREELSRLLGRMGEPSRLANRTPTGALMLSEIADWRVLHFKSEL